MALSLALGLTVIALGATSGEAAAQTALKQDVQMVREQQQLKVIETGWKYEPSAAPAP